MNTPKVNPEEFVSFKSRAECLKDIYKCIVYLQKHGIGIVQYMIHQTFSFERGLPGDLEFTFIIPKGVDQIQLYNTIMDAEDCHRIADTFKPEAMYDGYSNNLDQFDMEESED
jgi:hypothetical protein